MLVSMSLTASDFGEFGLIERLLARLGGRDDDVVVGPGDDAAAIRVGERTLLATADLLLEGVHFEIGLSSPSDVGWKALAVNVSDIAAMGGRPRFALVSLGAPRETPASTLEQIYSGLDECARAFEVQIVGGDTVRSDRLIVSIAALGELDGGAITRAGGGPGDLLCVTGAVGVAAAGLALLRAASADESARELLGRFPNLAQAHRRPVPRVREGLAAARVRATAMIDLSDGLGADVGHLCDASGTGAVIDAESVPLAAGVAETAAWAGAEPVAFAVAGGDDYELAIAAPPDRVEQLAEGSRPTPVTTIGRLADGGGVRLSRANGATELLAGLGWDHFGGEA